MNLSVKRMTTISLMTAMMIVFTVVFPILTVPIIGINFTLQTLVVMIAGMILAPIDALISMILYLIIGAFGIPVFSGPTGGLGVLIGPKGGFYLSFPMVAFLISYYRKEKFLYNLLLNILFGIILVYLIGTMWLNFYIPASYLSILKSMLVFIPTDFIKVIIATLVSIKLSKILKET